MTPTEHQIQSAFFDYVAVKRNSDWRWWLVFAVPNGAHLKPSMAAKMKAEGMTSGVADVLCLVPAHGHCGLCLEFKRPRETQSENQKRFENYVHTAGYMYSVVRDAEAAIKLVERWFGKGKV